MQGITGTPLRWLRWAKHDASSHANLHIRQMRLKLLDPVRRQGE